MKEIPPTLESTPMDDEEKATMTALDRAFENGELVSRLTNERQTELREAARNTLNPRKKLISARLPERDL